MFAPTNEAFDDISDIAPTDPVALADILFYHALTEEVLSTGIPAIADSASGITLFFDTSNGVQVNQANVAIADIRTTNGIVHVIDSVLLPPDIPTAAGYAGLDQLVGAVTAADPSVLATLTGEGPFTVFAPTNEAFDAITAPTDPVELADILFYHALTSEVDSASIPARADSANNLTMFFDTSNGVAVNGANVVIADVQTTNGIVHVIDSVLLPPNIVDAAGLAGLTELGAAVGAADASVLSALTSPGPFTVFAPNDAAFQAIQAPTDPAELADILFYHAYPGSFDSANLPAKADSALATSFPNPTNVSALISTDGGANINGVSIVATDVRTTNGIVHVIDQVLLPPSILDLAGIAGLGSLANALAVAPAPNPGDLLGVLSGDGPFTVFAPTDAAFAAAPAVSGADLANVLLYHVVDTSVTSPVLAGDLEDGEVPTALGGTDTITVDTTAGTVEGANLALTDVNGTNGTVHVIDAVMIPPSFGN